MLGQWNNGRRQDGWGRYTRRRKWYRDAELVERDPDDEPEPTELPAADVSSQKSSRKSSRKSEGTSDAPNTPRRGIFRNKPASARSSTHSNMTAFSSDDEADHRTVPERPERESGWDVGDDMKMGLG
jgi:hypothetical protein